MVETQSLTTQLLFLLALFFEVYAFEELDQDFPQLAKQHLKLVFASETYLTSQAYLSSPQMIRPAMKPVPTLVTASELAAVVVGEWFSAAFVGNWWQRTHCFEVNLWMTTTKG